MASNAWLQKHPDAAREFVGIIGKTANWANSHPKESAEIAGKTTGYPVEQTTNWHYAPNALLDKASLALWWDLVKDTGTPLAGSEKLKPEDIATNAFNPYATSADLLRPSGREHLGSAGFPQQGSFQDPIGRHRHR